MLPTTRGRPHARGCPLAGRRAFRGVGAGNEAAAELGCLPNVADLTTLAILTRPSHSFGHPGPYALRTDARRHGQARRPGQYLGSGLRIEAPSRSRTAALSARE